VRVEPWLQAGKYIAAVASDIAKRNGWTIAEAAGDRTPQRTQRLLNRAVWDTFAAMGVVRRFAVTGLDDAARRHGRRRGLRIGAIDETSQVKPGTATADVKQHYLGCLGKVANGITTVHLAYVRERTGHALIGARQWIPPSTSATRRSSGSWACPTIWCSAPRGSLPSRSAPRRSLTAPGSTFCAGMRSTAVALNYASSAKNTAKGMYCGFPPPSSSRWRPGSHCLARRRSPACSKAPAAGRSALPGPVPRASAGMPGRGWPPPPRGITC
jgi:hypothetical protein